MANMEMGFIKKISIWLGILIASITVVSSGYYFVSDRFTVIAQVNRNTEDIQIVREDVSKLRQDFLNGAEERNRKIDDLIFNQKRMMDRLGLKWEPFDERK